MSYEARTIRHLAIMQDKTLPQYKRSFAGECLGALYMAYKLDSRQMKSIFMSDHGLSEIIADAVIKFGEAPQKSLRVYNESL